MSDFQLAQLNVAKMKYSVNSHEMNSFVSKLDIINSIADRTSGFIWRSQSADENLIVTKLFGSQMIINMSVWSDINMLHNFVYKTEHKEMMSKRNEWFEKLDYAYSVLWWIPKNTKPTFVEAKEKLRLLNDVGETVDAFTFKNLFPAP
ncbi:MAG: DUF3291 domain-containing protein [Gammaproteobacteria bacterium]